MCRTGQLRKAESVATLQYAVVENQSVEMVRSLLENFEIVAQDLAEIICVSFRDQEKHDSNYIALMRLLIEHDPKVARLRFDNMNSLLHFACWYGAPIQVVQLLIRINPDAVQYTCRKDLRLPLHHACCRKDASAIDIVRLLLSHYPKGAQRAERYGCLPLHFAAKCVAPEEVIVALLEAYPQGATLKDTFGGLPIDFSYGRLNIIHKMVKYCAECIRLRNGPNALGDLPLHRAIRYQHATFEVIQFMVDQYPSSVKVKGQEGMFPLHRAVSNTPHKLQNVKFLIDCFPGGLCYKDDYGKLPIHYACRSGSLEIVKLLIESDKRPTAGLDVADNAERLPLHHAAASVRKLSRMAPNKLRFVLNRHRQGIYAADNQGMLPLHLACLRHPSNTNNIEMIRILLEEDLFTILRARNDGKTPLQLTFLFGGANRQPREIQQLLLEKQDEALSLLLESFMPTVEHYNLPCVIVSQIWEFVMEKPWRPTQDEMNT